MAKVTRPQQSTAELRERIRRTREEVARDLSGVRYEMDIPRKIRRSFRRQPGGWITAALVVGTLVVLLPMRRKKVYIDLQSGTKGKAKPGTKLLETGFLLGMVRVAASLLKPAIASFVTKKIQDYSQSRGRTRF
jgi:hypothetical protein